MTVAPKPGDGYLESLVLSAKVLMRGGFEGTPMTFDLNAGVRREVRVKVTAVSDAKIRTLSLEYGKCLLEMSGMGQTHTEPMPTEGRGYRVDVGERELTISSRSGAQPSEEEVGDVRDDARSYLALDLALRSTDQNGNAPSDVSSMARLPPADTDGMKITENKTLFRGFEQSKNGGRQAVYDLTVAMEGKMEQLAIQGRLEGTMLLGTSPWRPLSVKGSGPITLAGSDADFAASGSGTMALEITYSR